MNSNSLVSDWLPHNDPLHSTPLPSATGEDRDDRDGSRSLDERRTAEVEVVAHILEESLRSIQQLQRLVWGRKRGCKPDFLRAHTLIDGLEPISKGLLARYQATRGEDHSEGVLCTVCHESLDLDSSYDAGDQDPLEPIQTENKKLLLALPYYSAIPEVVALPCLHLFHSECLSPWLAMKTTCPMCRFDVDPDLLALRGGSAQRPWVPPATGVLEAWVKAEEERVSSGLSIDAVI